MYKTFHRKKIVVTFFLCVAMFLGLFGRLIFLMIGQAEYYTEKAEQLHERERSIKAARGRILDRNGVVLADNKTVCTVSVIHSQITDPDKVVEVLSKELLLDEQKVRERVEKYTSIERIKSNVDKETGDRIRAYDLAGVKVDEDYKRYYPYGELASKVLGFTGSDNQGIIGLEVIYDAYLQGTDGTILTLTDAKGVELKEGGEGRIEPVSGKDLQISMDINIQMYATQLAKQVMETKQATGVSIIVMQVKTGEVLAMVNVPEFDLNHPYTLTDPYLYKEIKTTVEENGEMVTKTEKVAAAQEELTDEEYQDRLNRMWRNGAINDTYEPGSTFKIITAAAGLEEGVVTVHDTFSCPGYIVVEDRKIRCHKVGGHGAETFVDGTMNSCNPVFVTVGMRIGAQAYYDYFEKFGLLGKTGIDLPGEAATIMHKKDAIGAVELATISFGQSFQVTPMQLMTTASSIVNDGTRVTPHFGVAVTEADGGNTSTFSYEQKSGVVSEETSETMRYMLEQVVENGGGKNAYIEGFRIAGKTATSQTLPRGTGNYIASFLGFAPAQDPEVAALVIINKPQGLYYGGQIAAPVIRQLFENILPYLEGMDYN